MKIKLIIFALLSFTTISFGQQVGAKKDYVLIATHNSVQYKNFYLLTLFQKEPQVKNLLLKDDILSKILQAKKENITDAVKNCNKDIGCFTKALKFSDSEIEQVGNRLATLYTKDNSLGLLIKNHVIPSGCYNLYADLNASESLRKAWEQDAKAINHIISVYVEGQKPNYAAIDSISFNVKDKSYPEIVATNAILSLNSSNNLFFEPSMQVALVALEINERNDAADYEPMISTVNKAALLSIKKTNFANYKYSTILVPGEGPEENGVELSAGGMLRCRLAAEQFHKGLAPFIMVSGGRVHPYKTKYSEAYEMKKFFMNTLQIPESVIIMEPHARHTTTNLRNAARLIFRYGMPINKPGLVVTVKSQSFYISEIMHLRCIKELGYDPYKNGNRLSDTALEFYPNVNSLQIDFDEPMDP
ncbi:YdcF family protein [Pedobacter fastidiosus]|uniref:YdcF family protein n=1 Tax=Pedobacter fastidiosus TaxID=2765361 RepID=A0ABR7KQV5_9SPHI|nr:YdcF family protein [Pedobacter fastidiosus]MBC6110093.1 YdcF family protein [Pedobacter fastidiosus]